MMRRFATILLPFLVVLVLTSRAEPADRFVDNVTLGSGNCSSAGNACQFSAVWAVAVANDVIRAASGTVENPKVYAGTANMIQPPAFKSGTQAQPIVVRAEVDGGVVIDGELARRPLFLVDSSWITIEGFNIKRAGGASDGTSVCRVNRGTGVILRRLVCWDAVYVGTGSDSMAVDMTGTNHLAEDIAAFGRARKAFQFQLCNGCIARRIWANFGNIQALESNPRQATQMAYNSSNTLGENVISTWSAEVVGTDTGSEEVVTAPSSIQGFNGTENRYYGAITYLKCNAASGYVPSALPMVASAKSSTNVRIRDSVAVVEQSGGATCWPGRIGHGLGSPGTGAGEATRLSTWGATNSISGWTQTAVNVGSTDPATGSYGAPGSPWDPGNTTGARVCFRTVNGTVTNDPLWPWPMDERIKQARIQSGYAPLAGTEQNVTSEIESLLGPIPLACRTEAGPQPPQATGLVAQYLLDEAASGTAPAAALDSSGVGAAVDLTHNYASNVAYVAPGTGRGLEWTTALGNGGPSVDITGTKVRDSLQGKQRITMAFAINLNATPTFARIAEISFVGGTNARLQAAVLANGDGFRSQFNSVAADWTSGVPLTSGRVVGHVVWDTTQAIAANRVRLYINGVDQGNFDTGSAPGQSATLDLQTGTPTLVIGNRPEGGRSPDGIISHFALYDQALTATEVLAEATALIADDDAGGTGGTQPPTAIIYDGESGSLASHASVATLSPGLPVNNPIGNRMVLINASRTTGTAPSWTVPVGWTQIGSTCHQTGSRNIALSAFQKVVAPGEVSPQVQISDVGFGHASLIVSLRNVDTVTPLDIAAACEGAGAQMSWVPTGLTTATDKALVVVIAATPDLNALAVPCAVDENFTVRCGGPTWDTADGPVALAVVTHEKTSAGGVTIPAFEQTTNGVDEWIGMKLVFRLSTGEVPPPPQGGGTVPIGRPVVTDRPVATERPLVTDRPLVAP